MFKIVAVIARRQGSPVDEFQARWGGAHAELVAAAPGLRRYVQSHALPQGYAKGELPFDGISELWFDDADAYVSWIGSRHHAETVRAASGLLDLERTFALEVDVRIIVDGGIPAGGVKNIEFVRRRADLDDGEFRRYWEHTHGPLASGIRTLLRYEQNHLSQRERDSSAPRLDGLAITWFESTAKMREGAASEVYERTRADEANFLLLTDGHLPFIVTRERVILAGAAGAAPAPPPSPVD